ncbi:transcription factor lepE, partial [Echria macrotheca]
RNRLRLNCGECRSKKLSCDRKLPCQRCMRAGKPDLCSFGPGTRPPPTPPANAGDSDSVAQTSFLRNSQELQELRDEVARLKAQLESRPAAQPERVSLEGIDEQQPTPSSQPEKPSQDGIADPQDRSPRVYYRQHVLMRFTYDMPQIFPLIKEMVREYIQPRGIAIKKIKPPRLDHSSDSMQALLPPKSDTDELVAFYLEHLECIHHVVHIPTFRSEYEAFWLEPQASATAAMILAMISTTTACVTATISESTYGIASKYRNMPPVWIHSCDMWVHGQRSKSRHISYYQVACLLYFAKRMNIIRKKKFWNETGRLVQQAVLDGFHLVPPNKDTAYMKEMKSRIWATIRELDLQTAAEYGLPSLLHVLESDIAAPTNVDDDDFGPSSSGTLPAKPPTQYTRASFQILSSRSWNLRLEISRALFATGTHKTLPYDQVLKLTSEVNQAMAALPTWDRSPGNNQINLTSAYLCFALHDCLMSLHRGHIDPQSPHASLSSTISTNAACQILHLNADLASHGLQSLALLREDLLVSTLTLTRIALLQPPGPTSSLSSTTDSETILTLLESTLPLVEDRYLRSYYGEPWTPITMLSAIMMIQIHSGRETRASAKQAGAQRFLETYYRHPTQQ